VEAPDQTRSKERSQADSAGREVADAMAGGAGIMRGGFRLKIGAGKDSKETGGRRHPNNSFRLDRIWNISMAQLKTEI
jgi:hypothetical protein